MKLDNSPHKISSPLHATEISYPILRLPLMLKIDTRVACKVVSEPVCKIVLSKLDPLLAFERNYNHIRQYHESCEERIHFKGEKDSTSRLAHFIIQILEN